MPYYKIQIFLQDELLETKRILADDFNDAKDQLSLLKSKKEHSEILTFKMHRDEW